MMGQEPVELRGAKTEKMSGLSLGGGCAVRGTGEVDLGERLQSLRSGAGGGLSDSKICHSTRDSQFVPVPMTFSGGRSTSTPKCHAFQSHCTGILFFFLLVSRMVFCPCS